MRRSEGQGSPVRRGTRNWVHAIALFDPVIPSAARGAGLSGLLARLMNGVPWIIWLGGVVLGYVAGDMILDDEALRSWLGDAAAPLAQIIPIALATVLGALGWWFAERPRRVASTK